MRFRISRHPSGCLAIPALNASLGLITDTLNYNWHCAYANDFLSLLKTSTWTNQGPLLKRSLTLCWGIALEGLMGFEPRKVLFKVNLKQIAVKFSRLNWEECGPCPVFECYTLAFALQVRKKHRKRNLSQSSLKVPLGQITLLVPETTIMLGIQYVARHIPFDPG